MRRTVCGCILVLALSSALGQQDFLDPTFHGTGILTYGNSAFHEERANAVVVQANGSIVAGGQDFNVNTWTGSWFAFRCTADGEPDTTFGPNGTGYALYDFDGLGANDGTIYALDVQATQTSNTILAAGFVNADGAGWKFVVVRLLGDGTLDPTFSGDGIVFMDLGTDSTERIATSVKGLPDGRIMAAGFDNDWGLLSARLLADGTPDTTYAPNGLLELNIPGFEFGDACTMINDSGEVFAIATSNGGIVKLDANGDLDASFGNNGISTELAWTVTIPKTLAQRPTGELVIGCLGAYSMIDHRTLVAQFTPSGQLDTTFGFGGVSLPAPGSTLWVNDVVLLPSGRVAVGYQGGVDSLESYNFLTAMFSVDGMVDPLWGIGGVLQTDLDTTANPPFGSNDAMWGLACQPDGKLVGTGPTASTSDNIGIVRYAPETTLGVAPLSSESASMLVFPNPCKAGGVLHVNMEATNARAAFLRDALGRLVATWQLPAGSTSTNIQLPVHLAGGHYVFEMRTEERSMIARLIIEP
ncbi:MAG: hypothetical protein ABI599_03825 [Flavobacteriales bacterium]